MPIIAPAIKSFSRAGAAGIAVPCHNTARKTVAVDAPESIRVPVVPVSPADLDTKGQPPQKNAIKAI